MRDGTILLNVRDPEPEDFPSGNLPRILVRNFAADKETLVRANKSEAPVRWPGTDTYQIGLETFHQLHCLVCLSRV